MAFIDQKALYGPTLKRDARQAERHLRALNRKAGHVFPHCMAALEEGMRGRIIDPQASGRSNKVSRNVHLLVLYHLFLKRKHLPPDVAKMIASPLSVGKRSIDGSFGLFNEARKKMYKGDVKGFARMFNDERIPMQKRLEVLLAHMSDAMTLHSPETLEALSYGKLKAESDGNELMFANPFKQWERQVPNMARTMNSVLCPAADLFGLSYIYRKIRDVSAQHIHPGIYAEVVQELVKLQDAIMKTNLLFEDIIRMTNDACESRGFRVRIIRRNQDDTRSHESGEDERKSNGSITDKLAKRRALGEDVQVRGLHDIVARMAITDSLEELDFAIGFLKDTAIPRVLGKQGIRFSIEHKDYVRNPKEKTGYRSHHIDTEIDSPYLVNFEVIGRTKEMHEEADCGAYAHHIYKEGVLENGLLLSFKSMLGEIINNGKRHLQAINP